MNGLTNHITDDLDTSGDWPIACYIQTVTQAHRRELDSYLRDLRSVAS